MGGHAGPIENGAPEALPLVNLIQGMSQLLRQSLHMRDTGTLVTAMRHPCSAYGDNQAAGAIPAAATPSAISTARGTKLSGKSIGSLILLIVTDQMNFARCT